MTVSGGAKAVPEKWRNIQEIGVLTYLVDAPDPAG